MSDSRSNNVATKKKPDQRSDHKKPTVMIYFHSIPEHDGSDLRIKVGSTSTSVQKRKSQHEANPTGSRFVPVWEDLCAVNGKPSDEKAIHNHFLKVKWPGTKETFEPAPVLVNYVRWLRDQYFVWVPDDPQCPPLSDLDPVDSGLWLPDSSSRLKPPPSGLIPGMFGPLSLPPRELTADDFYTNPIIIEAARALMGRIDVDPASHPIANREVKASIFYTTSNSGLDKPWHGKVWLNPPFSQWKFWVPKILGEWNSGRAEEMCVLSAMRTVTAQYFNPILKAADAMCVIKGRIKFWGGVAGDSPDDGHAIFYFGDNPQGFKKHFEDLGAVYFTARD